MLQTTMHHFGLPLQPARREKRIALRKISNVLHSLYCISFLFLLFLHLALQKRRDHAQTQISDAFRSSSPWQTPVTGFDSPSTPSKLSKIKQKSTKIKISKSISKKIPKSQILDNLGHPNLSQNPSKPVPNRARETSWPPLGPSWALLAKKP